MTSAYVDDMNTKYKSLLSEIHSIVAAMNLKFDAVSSTLRSELEAKYQQSVPFSTLVVPRILCLTLFQFKEEKRRLEAAYSEKMQWVEDWSEAKSEEMRARLQLELHMAVRNAVLFAFTLSSIFSILLFYCCFNRGAIKNDHEIRNLSSRSASPTNISEVLENLDLMTPSPSPVIPRLHDAAMSTPSKNLDGYPNNQNLVTPKFQGIMETPPEKLSLGLDTSSSSSPQDSEDDGDINLSA